MDRDPKNLSRETMIGMTEVLADRGTEATPTMPGIYVISWVESDPEDRDCTDEWVGLFEVTREAGTNAMTWKWLSGEKSPPGGAGYFPVCDNRDRHHNLLGGTWVWA